MGVISRIGNEKESQNFALRLAQKRGHLQIICLQLCDWYAMQGQMAEADSYYRLHPSELIKQPYATNSSVDLHGLTAGSAYFACQPLFQTLKRGETLCLITGKGYHSKHKQGFYKLRDSLMALIQKYQPQLKVKVSFYNDAVLAVNI